MRKTTKLWLVMASALVLLGGILFVGLMSKLNWDFMKLSTFKYKTNTYEIIEAFDNISMNTDTADIVFMSSDNEKCRVECHEEENAKHSVLVKDGTLTVELIDERTVFDFIGLNFDSPKITVYLPKTEYTNLLINGDTSDVEIPNNFIFKNTHISLTTGDVDFCASTCEMVKIKVSTGDICVRNTVAESLNLFASTGDVDISNINCKGDVNVSVSTGKTRLANITCKSVISNGNTGDISLDNVVGVEKFSIKRSTGDVKFISCDASEIYVITDTGDVRGDLLSNKVFITETDTGSVNVPNSVTGGRCEITTDTGDIKLDIK